MALEFDLTCAAPAYIDRFGMPVSVDALGGHRMVGFRSSAMGALLPLEFMVNGVLCNVSLPATVAVNGAESFVAAARRRHPPAEEIGVGQRVSDRQAKARYRPYGR